MTAGPDAGRAPARARWGLLAAFALLVACTQVLWLTFAPITASAHRALGVSEGAVGDLAVVNPLTYVLLALPAGRWMDRRFVVTLAAGAACTALGAVLRTLDPGSYPWILAGQLVVSVGQPLVLNASTAIAARYFPPAERTAAISVATAAQFVGILAAALSSGPLVAAGGLALLLRVDAGLAVVAAVAVGAGLRLVPAGHRGPVGHHGTDGAATAAGTLSSWRSWLRHDRLLWTLAGLLFVGVGLFNAVATWLDPILTGLGRPGTGGTVIAVMTVAGIAGAALLPGVVARRDARQELMLVTTVTTVVVFCAVAVVPGALFATVALAVEGFVLLAALPVALDWSELAAGPDRAGTATGLLFLAGNLGGVVLVLVVQPLIDHPRAALLALAAVGLPGVLLAARLPRHARSHGDPTRPASADLGR